ncbi:conserved hypothetical protein [Uncinocarpus reesii 1704]|uniref:Sucrose transporter n=1 Tax=Uncinocarpus reesii (strain UAMH 1704) TaxID=336963 RepID=C4JZM1_UNCRE|nr:uncharacterized protein UREG_07622 [Uncinocarpus reesii 1704]EEP82757.1 conserved hypothetical protein [Uncinocarpus reesii 1704]
MTRLHAISPSAGIDEIAHVSRWTTEIVSLFISDPQTRKSVTIAVAVLSIYAVDFAINVVQACCRSLIVDTLPIPQQQLGSAWAGRMTAVGSLIGYAIGSIDMLNSFGTAPGKYAIQADDSHRGVVAHRSSICHFICCEGEGPDISQDHFQPATPNQSNMLGAILGLDCSTWVGETYFRYEASESTAEQSKDTLGEVGRLGSLSLVVFSMITLLSSVILPFGVVSPENKRGRFTPRPPRGVVRFLKRIAFVRPDLQTAWMLSHIMFAATMIFAPLAKSVRFATFLVAICGVPWAVTSWAPFAFMGVEINRLAVPASSSRNSTVTMITSTRASNRHSAYLPLEADDGNNSDPDFDTASVLRLNHRNDGDSDTDGDLEDEAASTGELAGIYLGVLNVYTTLPQFVGTFISWIVFSIFEPNRTAAQGDTDSKTGPAKSKADHWMNLSAEGPNGIAVCLFIGAICAMIATEATRRLKYVR